MRKKNGQGKFLVTVAIIVLLLLIIFFAYTRYQQNQREEAFEEQRDTTSGDEGESGFAKIISKTEFSWPKSIAPFSKGQLIKHSDYTLSYLEEHEQANWVAYRLTATELKGESKRKDNFKADPLVATGSAHPEDYQRSGFDRGHLAPAADFTYSEQAMEETFFMSNMSPQHPSFNRGIWKKLEDKTRDWAREDADIFIITGPVLKGKMKKIGKNKVSVPPYFYKIVLDAKEPEIKMIAFLLPNKKSNKAITSFIVSVDSIESLTGLDFFYLLPDSLEDALEQSTDKTLWFD